MVTTTVRMLDWVLGDTSDDWPVLSLGLGLAVLVAISLIQSNLSRQVDERLPEMAPAFFFIDIQPHQVAAFDKILAGFNGTGAYRRVASLRGRIVKIAGKPHCFRLLHS